MLPERRLLDRLEIDDRAVVVENRAEFVVLRLREIPLGLEDEEAGRLAGGELLLLRLEPPLLQLARRLRARHALLVRRQRTRGVADLRGDLQLLILELRLRRAPVI